MNTPSVAQKQQAVREGAAVRFGLPTMVRVDGGVALLNLADAQKKLPDPWCVEFHDPVDDVIDVWSATERMLIVQGRQAEGGDIRLVKTAFEQRSSETDRHAQAGEEARRAAGSTAMKIVDAHLRAIMLTLVDGWSAACGEPIDLTESDGELYSGPGDQIVNILIVTCPSTGRRYAHAVPQELRTAKAARMWMLSLPENAEMDAET